MDHFKNFVEDKSIKVGSKKHALTNNDYVIPIIVKNELPYIHLRPYTDQEWLAFHHSALTSETNWEPTCLYSSGSIANEIWHDTQSSTPQSPSDATFNECGCFRNINQ